MDPLSTSNDIQISDNGTSDWKDKTGSLTYLLKEADIGKFFRSNSIAIDSIEQELWSESGTIGPVIAPTEIGFVSITVDGVLTTYGEPIYCKVNDALAVEAAIAGDASPSYKWEARGNYPMVVSEQAAITTLTFPQEGSATVTLTLTDRTATDSPITYGMTFYIASQAEWEALHPDA